MPVSGTTTFTMTALDIVTNAMLKLGVLSSGEAPTAPELEDGITALNLMLKAWQTKGCDLWREDDRSVTISANTTPTALATDIRQVFSGRFIGTNYERMLGKWERADYLALPIKTTTGDPFIFYVSRGRDGLNMYVWPIPTADSTVKIDCERIVDTVADGSDEVDVPQHALSAVTWSLAAELIALFNTSGVAIAPATAGYVTQKAAQEMALLMDDDRPESISIGPF